MSLIITVARFNELTYEENKKYRSKSSFNCIYGFDKEISRTIPYESYVYVIEMNNTTNEIMGIGKIKNVLKDENRRRIYENENYNRYVYNGKHRIGRLELLDKNVEIIESLERILFKGARHFKRGHGLTVVPHNRFGCVYKKKKRKQTRCTICDKVGHNKTTCPHKGEKKKKKPVRNYYRKRCDKCGQIEKGHICPALDIDTNKIKCILDFFQELF